METEQEKQPGRLAKGNPANAALIATILNHPLAQIWQRQRQIDPANINNYLLEQIEEGKAEELNKLFFPWSLDAKQQRFKNACDESDLKTVRSMIDDPEINPAAQKNLIVGNASENGYLSLLEILLANKRVNPADDDDYAIRVACKAGHVAVVKHLLSDKRINPCIRENRPLQLAAEQKHVFTILLLLCDPRIYKQGMELLLNSMETPEEKKVVERLYTHYEKHLLFKRSVIRQTNQDIAEHIDAFYLRLA